MDLQSVVGLVTTAAASVAGEAGRQAWDALLSLTRRVTGRAEPDPEPVDPSDDEAVRALARRLAQRAEGDEEFAAQLRDWARTHRSALDGGVHNEVSGEARVTGPVIQAGTINGGISFGS
ncbi:hypothetical protein [Streptomyces profundus]|uniref:hypothetical protein n=1 Tax=Streptomyces profundus TaxID=2867410 RepID=UPI001D168AF0|nr:hypothetical protein [Streptomyces sp. MA3_2.13]UED83586.1 hypothetical protein K4G22_04670 [Streptomyces sp. MA3_2.13]